MRKSIHSEKYKLLTELLVQARTDAGLTQQQVADALGKPQSFVAKYENGERRLDVIEFLEVSGVIGCDATAVICSLVRGNSPGDQHA